MQTNSLIKTNLRTIFDNRFDTKKCQTFILVYFIFNIILAWLTSGHAIGDFGNYYYGSKFFKEGINPLKFYQSIHFFNTEIRRYEGGTFFENYTPVPPFSLIFYLPFTFFKLTYAKFCFNLVSVFIFCFSFQRLIKTLKIFGWYFYLLPLIFFQPLYSNFHHGQTYVLIAALFFEFYLALQSNKKIVVAIIIALLFSLKIFPAFIAIIFLFKRDWKTLGWILVTTVFIQFVVYCFVGKQLMSYYYLQTLPRLALNEVTAPFSFFNQSLHAFLLNFSVYHPYLNPNPVVNSPLAATIINLLFYSFVFGFFINCILKYDTYISFFSAAMVLVLLNKYSTVYGLIVLFPFIFILQQVPIKMAITLIVLLFLANNLPIYKLGDLSLTFQYSKVWVLILFFCAVVFALKINFSWRYFMLSAVIFILPSLVFFKYKTNSSIEFRPKTGIMYDYEVTPTQIKLHNCLGNRDTIEIINFTSNKIDSNTNRRKPLNLLKPKVILLNDTSQLFMTDENAGVGMYYLKLATITRKNN